MCDTIITNTHDRAECCPHSARGTHAYFITLFLNYEKVNGAKYLGHELLSFSLSLIPFYFVLLTVECCFFNFFVVGRRRCSAIQHRCRASKSRTARIAIAPRGVCDASSTQATTPHRVVDQAAVAAVAGYANFFSAVALYCLPVVCCFVVAAAVIHFSS